MESETRVVPKIESMLSIMTPTELDIAYFFIQNEGKKVNLSASVVSQQIYVSEASLTRFAKKIGYDGYREFIYDYERSNKKKTFGFSNVLTQQVLNSYEELMDKTYSIVDEEQLYRVVNLMSSASRFYFYGKGSSASAAQEMKLRFMRLGIMCEAVTDNDLMLMNSAILNEDCLVFALSLSGETDITKQAAKLAKDKKARTILLTSRNQKEFQQYIDEVVFVSSMSTLDTGHKVSPQFPLLIIIDILYKYYLEINKLEKENIFSNTLDVLNKEN